MMSLALKNGLNGQNYSSLGSHHSVQKSPSKISHSHPIGGFTHLITLFGKLTSRTPKFGYVYVITYANFMLIVETR